MSKLTRKELRHLISESLTPNIDADIKDSYEQVEKINKEINRLENIPFDPHFHDVTQMEINDLQYDAAFILRYIAQLERDQEKQNRKFNK